MGTEPSVEIGQCSDNLSVGLIHFRLEDKATDQPMKVVIHPRTKCRIQILTVFPHKLDKIPMYWKKVSTSSPNLPLKRARQIRDGQSTYR